MMNEEMYIEEKVGRRTPFRVPEDYFDTMASRVMAQLPDRKPRARVVRIRPWLYACAAAVCALFISTAVWLAWPQDTAQPMAALSSAPEQAEDSFDQAADYMMVDNHEIYAYLADY